MARIIFSNQCRDVGNPVMVIGCCTAVRTSVDALLDFLCSSQTLSPGEKFGKNNDKRVMTITLHMIPMSTMVGFSRYSLPSKSQVLSLVNNFPEKHPC